MFSAGYVRKPRRGAAWITFGLLVAALAQALWAPAPVQAASAAELRQEASRVLTKLYAKVPIAKELATKASGILVFPGIVKGGFLVGGLFGEGVLLKQGHAVAYYNTVAASYGFQAGIQKYGYAMFFMNPAALQYLDKSDGWEVGTGPSLVVLDQGMAAGFSTSTLRDDIYAFIFNQQGLMGGIGLQATKITRIEK